MTEHDVREALQDLADFMKVETPLLFDPNLLPSADLDFIPLDAFHAWRHALRDGAWAVASWPLEASTDTWKKAASAVTVLDDTVRQGLAAGHWWYPLLARYAMAVIAQGLERIRPDNSVDPAVAQQWEASFARLMSAWPDGQRQQAFLLEFDARVGEVRLATAPRPAEVLGVMLLGETCLQSAANDPCHLDVNLDFQELGWLKASLTGHAPILPNSGPASSLIRRWTHGTWAIDEWLDWADLDRRYLAKYPHRRWWSPLVIPLGMATLTTILLVVVVLVGVLTLAYS